MNFKTKAIRAVLLCLLVTTWPVLLRADEKDPGVLTALSSTTLSGYVNNGSQWHLDAPDPVPEPSTWALLALGLGTVAFVNKRRKSQT